MPGGWPSLSLILLSLFHKRILGCPVLAFFARGGKRHCWLNFLGHSIVLTFSFPPFAAFTRDGAPFFLIRPARSKARATPRLFRTLLAQFLLDDSFRLLNFRVVAGSWVGLEQHLDCAIRCPIVTQKHQGANR